ncbi:MAG: hydantoinase/carbamoylase family amidase [Bauldia sp.]
MPTEIVLDPELIERRIMALAEHGAHSGTGVWRTVYSPEWVAATDLYAKWCAEAGLKVTRDAVGNIWGRLEGTGGGKAIVSGSHIDTQRPGGRYDGALGALAGLIAIAALKEQFGPPLRPLEALALCEEEGSRFPTANFWGSRGITGTIPPGTAEAMRSYDGESMAEIMRSVGLPPERIGEAVRTDLDNFIELHIEQGPVLEQANLPVAVVTGITGLRHYTVELTGTANHAGAFPMDMRRDPMAGFAEIVSTVIDTAHRLGRPYVTTVGRAFVEPNGAAIIPGSVRFSVDARHPDPAAFHSLCATHEKSMRAIAERRNLDVGFAATTNHEPCLSDPGLLAALEASASGQGIPHMKMASGAAHDAQQMAKIARVAMVFVRSKDGRSHTPEEFSSIPDIVAGIRVLAGALHALAY